MLGAQIHPRFFVEVSHPPLAPTLHEVGLDLGEHGDSLVEAAALWRETSWKTHMEREKNIAQLK